MMKKPAPGGLLSPNDSPESSNNMPALAATETAMVNRSKIGVCLVVLLAAAVTGTATYIFMEQEEEGWYKDEVDNRMCRCMRSTDQL